MKTYTADNFMKMILAIVPLYMNVELYSEVIFW